MVDCDSQQGDFCRELSVSSRSGGFHGAVDSRIRTKRLFGQKAGRRSGNREQRKHRGRTQTPRPKQGKRSLLTMPVSLTFRELGRRYISATMRRQDFGRLWQPQVCASRKNLRVPSRSLVSIWLLRERPSPHQPTPTVALIHGCEPP